MILIDTLNNFLHQWHRIVEYATESCKKKILEDYHSFQYFSQLHIICWVIIFFFLAGRWHFSSYSRKGIILLGFLRTYDYKTLKNTLTWGCKRDSGERERALTLHLKAEFQASYLKKIFLVAPEVPFLFFEQSLKEILSAGSRFSSFSLHLVFCLRPIEKKKIFA